MNEEENEDDCGIAIKIDAPTPICTTPVGPNSGYNFV